MMPITSPFFMANSCLAQIFVIFAPQVSCLWHCRVWLLLGSVVEDIHGYNHNKHPHKLGYNPYNYGYASNFLITTVRNQDFDFSVGDLGTFSCWPFQLLTLFDHGATPETCNASSLSTYWTICFFCVILWKEHVSQDNISNYFAH